MSDNIKPGLHVSRLRPEASNPREVAFAESWAKDNKYSDILDLLFRTSCDKDDPDCINRFEFNVWINGYQKMPIGEPTERDRIVAATVIQWLGSNCGFSMIMEALEKCGYRIARNDNDTSASTRTIARKPPQGGSGTAPPKAMR